VGWRDAFLSLEATVRGIGNIVTNGRVIDTDGKIRVGRNIHERS